MGEDNITPFDIGIQTIKNEYARAMSGPASNAQLHVAAMAHADELINSSMNIAQLKAGFAMMRADIENQKLQAHEQLAEIKAQLATYPSHVGGQTPAGQKPSPAGQPEGQRQIRTNPKTGEVVEFDGTDWVKPRRTNPKTGESVEFDGTDWVKVK